HVYRAQGMVRRSMGDFAEARRLLQQALQGFDQLKMLADGARTQLELARTLSTAPASTPPTRSGAFRVGSPARQVTQAFLDALDRAEASRRPELVREAEAELQTVNELEYWKHLYHRVRGRGVEIDTTSLVTGETDVATAVFLNLREFVAFSQGLDAEEVMLTL